MELNAHSLDINTVTIELETSIERKNLFWATGLSFALHLLILFTPISITFHAVPLDRWYYWGIILVSSLIIIPAEETRKYLKRKKGKFE